MPLHVHDNEAITETRLFLSPSLPLSHAYIHIIIPFLCVCTGYHEYDRIQFQRVWYVLMC